jgi:hypothetical protein
MGEPSNTQFPITASKVRYIKLGVGNAWFEDCKRHVRMEFGHKAVPHDVATAGDKDAIAAMYRQEGRTSGKATGYAREVMDFYDRDEACLWITFADGCLWWGFAKADVEMLGETPEHGARARAMITSWSNRDAKGQVLTFGSLSTSLTQVALTDRPSARSKPRSMSYAASTRWMIRRSRRRARLSAKFSSQHGP